MCIFLSTDKNSVLGEAIKYLKQLQEQVTTLEEQVAKKTVESVTFVRKTQIYADQDETSSDENFDNQSNKTFPHESKQEFQTRMCLLESTARKTEGSYRISLTKSKIFIWPCSIPNVLHFGQSTLDITIVAQMEAEFSMTVKDLVKSLR